jgi:hypothetical protein
LLAIVFDRQGRPFAAGFLSAFAAGLWQFALFFPVWVIGRALVERRYQDVRRSITGGALITAIAVLPFVLHSAWTEMVAQAALSVFVSTEELAFVDRLLGGARALKLAAPLVPLGVIGAVRSRRDEEATWVLAGGLWFAVQVFFLDFDGAPDLLLGLVFLAIGVGLFVDSLPNRRQPVVIGAIVAIAVAMLAWTVHGGIFIPPADEHLQSLYWQQQWPADCHVRMSTMEQQFIETIRQRGMDADCSGYNLRAFV